MLSWHRQKRRTWVAIVCVAGSVSSAGCARTRPDETAEGTATLFVEKMYESQWNADSAKVAYSLLSERNQKNLSIRAERIGMVLGRRVTPENMLSLAPMLLRFPPRTYERGKTVEGRTKVKVLGELDSEEAELDLVSSDGRFYRVDLNLPDAPPKFEVKR
jgi:hypothetical protein